MSDGTRQRLRGLAPDLLAIGGLALLALAVYLPYATEAGWFLDDWSIYAEEKAIVGSFGDRMSHCMEVIPGGRKPACLYHVTEWSLLGDHRWAYHVVSIAFLVAIAALVYAIARRARLGRPWCLAIAAAVIVFPGGDSTRLWPVASIGQYAVVLQLVGMLVAIVALGRRPGRGSLALGSAAALIALLAMATYEIVVPLVALQGLVYVAIYRNRRAVYRWLLDLGLVFAFVLYRLVIDPVESESLVAERTSGQLVSRVGELLQGAWHTWHSLFAPGPLLALVLAILAAAALASFFSPELRSRLWRWWLLLGGAIVAAAACALVFITAEDAYVPIVFSIYNRVNLPGTVPYALAFVAVLGLLYELVRRWSPWALLAPLAVALLCLGSAQHQLAVSSEHQDDWLGSWQLQQEAIPGLQRAMRGVPTAARVFGFDTPQWERNWVPVINQTWDLRGLLSYETSANPVYASPFYETLTCARRGVVNSGELVAPYRDRVHQLYFASPSRGRAVRVETRHQCRQLVEAWGYPPFWTLAAAS